MYKEVDSIHITQRVRKTVRELEFGQAYLLAEFGSAVT